jgi:hypothetical protein
MAAASGCLMLALLGGCVGSQADSGEGAEVTSAAEALTSTTYSGRASVLRAQVLGITTGVVDTGSLPPTGGALHGSLPTANVPGLFTAATLDASTVGSGEQTVSQATAANVHLGLTVGGIAIGANLLASSATAACANHVPSLSASTTVAALTINGKSIVVTGAPNQTVNLLLGKVIINERSSTLGGAAGSIHAAPIHVIVAGLADVFICPSDAGITCAAPPPPPPPTCTDGIKNGSETDVDCGGPSCSPCADGGGCAVNGDCQSGECQESLCVEPACTPHQEVSGLGFIASTPTGSEGHFSFHVEIVGGAPTGYFTYDDDGSSEHIASIDFTNFSGGNTYSHFEGHAVIENKPGTFTYVVDMLDNGASGDVFFINVGDNYSAGGTVGGGDVQVVNLCQ